MAKSKGTAAQAETSTAAAGDANATGGDAAANGTVDGRTANIEATTEGKVAGISKFAKYKLPQSIDNVPLRGRILMTPEATTLDEMHLLVADGKAEHVLALAQAQFDIVIQRKLRDAAENEEITNILAGKVVELDGEKLDFSGMSDDERVEYALTRIQENVADIFRYGSRPLTTGGARVAKEGKEAIEREKALKAASAADPELAAKLAALGYKL